MAASCFAIVRTNPGRLTLSGRSRNWASWIISSIFLGRIIVCGAVAAFKSGDWKVNQSAP